MSDPLADLKDIHLPDAISWWPLAPGWWLLIFLVITLIILAVISYQFWKKRIYRRLALQELEELAANNSDIDENNYLESIACLIRRTAIAGTSDKQLAHWQGSQWQDYLQKSMPEDQARLIAISRYQANKNINKQQLTDAAKQWIKGHKA